MGAAMLALILFLCILAGWILSRPLVHAFNR